MGTTKERLQKVTEGVDVWLLVEKVLMMDSEWHDRWTGSEFRNVVCIASRKSPSRCKSLSIMAEKVTVVIVSHWPC